MAPPRKNRPVRDVDIADEIVENLNTAAVSAELQDYTDVLLGRTPAPVDHGEMNLAEVASAYLGRAKEIEMQIHRLERNGRIKRGSPFYRLRTGELRSFIDLCSNAYELGSRRITVAKMEQDDASRGM